MCKAPHNHFMREIFQSNTQLPYQSLSLGENYKVSCGMNYLDLLGVGS